MIIVMLSKLYLTFFSLSFIFLLLFYICIRCFTLCNSTLTQMETWRESQLPPPPSKYPVDEALLQISLRPRFDGNQVYQMKRKKRERERERKKSFICHPATVDSPRKRLGHRTPRFCSFFYLHSIQWKQCGKAVCCCWYCCLPSSKEEKIRVNL